MIRQIIKIDEDKCNGCGLCAAACHEGAIGIIGGKAKLLRDDYCDGMGDCLPECPVGAISFEEREASAYNEAAVAENKNRIANGIFKTDIPEKTISSDIGKPKLKNWPVQIKLVPVVSSYFENANLLIAADCTAYAYSDFHNDFIDGKITLIGCPKLDSTDYSVKLSEILAVNRIKNITVVRMEVPCCGGLVSAVKRAVEMSGKKILSEVFTISSDGRIIGREKF